jgi:hypothetical protein
MKSISFTFRLRFCKAGNTICFVNKIPVGYYVKPFNRLGSTFMNDSDLQSYTIQNIPINNVADPDPRPHKLTFWHKKYC